MDTPRHSWDIFRPFQKTTEPTQGPPRHSKSSLKHPQTLLDDCKDALGTPGDPLDPTRSFLDISRRFWMNLRTPMDQQEDPLDPPRPFWDISRPFWMAPGPPRPTQATPGHPKTLPGHLQTLPEDNRTLLTHLSTAQTLQVLSGTSLDPSGWLQDPTDPHEHPLGNPRHFRDIFRPFQRTTGPSEPN